MSLLVFFRKSAIENSISFLVAFDNVLFGAPDGGLRILYTMRKLRHIPHPAELIGLIPYPAGCSLFPLFLLHISMIVRIFTKE